MEIDTNIQENTTQQLTLSGPPQGSARAWYSHNHQRKII